MDRGTWQAVVHKVTEELDTTYNMTKQQQQPLFRESNGNAFASCWSLFSPVQCGFWVSDIGYLKAIRILCDLMNRKPPTQMSDPNNSNCSAPKAFFFFLMAKTQKQKRLRRDGKNTQKNVTKKLLMTQITMLMWSLTLSQTSSSVK